MTYDFVFCLTSLTQTSLTQCQLESYLSQSSVTALAMLDDSVLELNLNSLLNGGFLIMEVLALEVIECLWINECEI
jgi:hypothetical protein